MTEQYFSRRLPITGMTCGACVSHLEIALNSFPGVIKAMVNLESEYAHVTLQNQDVELSDLVSAVRNAGYDVSMDTIILSIKGLTCISCVFRVESALSDVPGVVKAEVNLSKGQALISYIKGVSRQTDIRNAVETIGYKVLEIMPMVS
ncbi:MAG: copper ion binding protein [Chloroflexota bacterium]